VIFPVAAVAERGAQDRSVGTGGRLRVASWRRYAITSRRNQATLFVGNRIRLGNCPCDSNRSMVLWESGTVLNNSALERRGDWTWGRRGSGRGMQPRNPFRLTPTNGL